MAPELVIYNKNGYKYFKRQKVYEDTTFIG